MGRLESIEYSHPELVSGSQHFESEIPK